MDSDFLDGCAVPIDAPLNDGQLDGFVLFADVDPDDAAAVAERISQYEQVFHA